MEGADRKRVRIYTLQWPIMEGDLGTQDLEHYYMAAQLQWPNHWLVDNEMPESIQVCDELHGKDILSWLLDRGALVERLGALTSIAW